MNPKACSNSSMANSLAALYSESDVSCIPIFGIPEVRQSKNLRISIPKHSSVPASEACHVWIGSHSDVLMVVCILLGGCIQLYSTFSLQLHGPSAGHRFSMLQPKYSKMLQSVVLAAVLWQHPDLTFNWLMCPPGCSDSKHLKLSKLHLIVCLESGLEQRRDESKWKRMRRIPIS